MNYKVFHTKYIIWRVWTKVPCVYVLFSLKNIHSMQYSRNDILLELLAPCYISILPRLFYIVNEKICWMVEMEYINLVVSLHNGLWKWETQWYNSIVLIPQNQCIRRNIWSCIVYYFSHVKPYWSTSDKEVMKRAKKKKNKSLVERIFRNLVFGVLTRFIRTWSSESGDTIHQSCLSIMWDIVRSFRVIMFWINNV